MSSPAALYSGKYRFLAGSVSSADGVAGVCANNVAAGAHIANNAAAMKILRDIWILLVATRLIE
jgi:hypothetical protein